MICYAIKNEFNEYLGIAIDVNHTHFWTTIEWAYLFRDVEDYPALRQAEDFRINNYPNCKVVKVKIKEVEENEEK